MIDWHLSLKKICCKIVFFKLISNIYFLYSITDEATQADILNNLPTLSNFYTNYSVYVWAPICDIQNDIPINGVLIDKDDVSGHEIYLARRIKNNDEIEVFGLSNKKAMEIETTEEHIEVKVLNIFNKKLIY